MAPRARPLLSRREKDEAGRAAGRQGAQGSGGGATAGHQRRPAWRRAPGSAERQRRSAVTVDRSREGAAWAGWRRAEIIMPPTSKTPQITGLKEKKSMRIFWSMGKSPGGNVCVSLATG